MTVTCTVNGSLCNISRTTDDHTSYVNFTQEQSRNRNMVSCGGGAVTSPHCLFVHIRHFHLLLWYGLVKKLTIGTQYLVQQQPGMKWYLLLISYHLNIPQFPGGHRCGVVISCAWKYVAVCALIGGCDMLQGNISHMVSDLTSPRR